MPCVSVLRKATHELWLTLTDWVCECVDESRTERIELTPEEYERVRENPTHFAVAPSEEHVAPDVERIVENHPALVADR
jgi:hypothetical protein